MTLTEPCKLVAVIGGGVIGGGWVARCLLNGITVNLYDPDPNTSSKIDEIMINAKLAFCKLIDGPVPPQGKFYFTDSIASAAAVAESRPPDTLRRWEVASWSRRRKRCSRRSSRGIPE